MKRFFIAFLMVTGMFAVKAQDETTFSDEDLKTYAVVMVWAEEQKGVMSDQLVDKIKSEAALEGRYNDMKAAYGDDTKLEEIGATEVEITAYEGILAYEDSIKGAFKDAYVGKIKGDIGVGLYNDLKKSLKSDDDVKARYEAVVVAVKEDTVTLPEEEPTGSN